MKTKREFVFILLLTGIPLTTRAQGTGFTYQGSLSDGGNPATGTYDFRFRLASDAQGNNYVGSPVVTNAVAVTAGTFTITLDFGAVFTGSNYWLEVDVRTNGASGFSILSPLQSLTPVPYALYAMTPAGPAGPPGPPGAAGAQGPAGVSPFTLAGTNVYYLQGLVGIGTTNPTASLDVNGIVNATGFNGNGSGLTGLDAANISSGTVSDGLLSAHVALLNRSQTFSYLNEFKSAQQFDNGANFGTGNSDYTRLQLGGGNSYGFLYGSYPFFGDGIHLGYNYYANGTTSFVPATDGATSRISVGYGTIVLAVGGIGAAPTIQRLLANASGVTVNGTFNNSSDRNLKQDFKPVSPSEILDAVAQLPLSEWSYKEDPSTRHIGPMGQDFKAAFRVGTDDKHIAPIDEGGVALAAIQGLNQRLEEQLKDKQTEISRLERRLEILEKSLAGSR